MNFIKKWENCPTKSQRQRSDMQHQLLPPGTAEEVLIVPGDTKKPCRNAGLSDFTAGHSP